MKNQPKKEKRPTEDERKKFKTAANELVNVIKTFIELNTPINVILSFVYRIYVAQKLISTLDKLKK